MKNIKAYHVDSQNKLALENQIIALNEIPKNWPNYEILKARYPKGLSHWGLTILGVQYEYRDDFINLTFREENRPETYWNSYLTDLLYEYERLANFPSMPSRLQSVFCSETVEEAREWKKMFNNEAAKIFEIEFDASQCKKLDASHLSGGIDYFQIHTIQTEAENYWSGHVNSEESKQELLVRLPVRLVKIVE